jgi:hypothetical protein
MNGIDDEYFIENYYIPCVPLYSACKNNKITIVKYILENINVFCDPIEIVGDDKIYNSIIDHIYSHKLLDITLENQNIELFKYLCTFLEDRHFKNLDLINIIEHNKIWFIKYIYNKRKLTKHDFIIQIKPYNNTYDQKEQTLNEIINEKYGYETIDEFIEEILE